MVSVSDQEKVPESIWHYTTAGGLDGILRSGSIYATDIQYLNDSREWTHISQIVREEVGSEASLEELSKLLTRFDDGVLGAIDCYVACFCTNGDLLNQWRGYSGGTGGFSIELNPSDLIRAQIAKPDPGDAWSHARVVYREDEQREFIREKLRESLPVLAQGLKDALADGTTEPHRLATMTAFGFALARIALVAPRFKAEAFESEEEWRMFKMIAHHDPSLREIRLGSFGLTPFMPLSLKADGGPSPIRGVVVGPTAHPELARKAAHQLLLANGHNLDFEKVTLSRVSFR